MSAVKLHGKCKEKKREKIYHFKKECTNMKIKEKLQFCI